MTPVSRMRLMATSSFHGARAKGTTSEPFIACSCCCRLAKSPGACSRSTISQSKPHWLSISAATGLSVCRKPPMVFWPFFSLVLTMFSMGRGSCLLPVKIRLAVCNALFQRRRVITELTGLLKQCHDVLGWYVVPDVVTRCKDITTVAPEVVDAPGDLVLELLGCCVRHHLLNIDRAME